MIVIIDDNGEWTSFLKSVLMMLPLMLMIMMIIIWNDNHGYIAFILQYVLQGISTSVANIVNSILGSPFDANTWGTSGL